MHGLSPVALHFLSGLLAHAPALSAFTNPTVNSYKRLNARGTTSGATWSPTAATCTREQTALETAPRPLAPLAPLASARPRSPPSCVVRACPLLSTLAWPAGAGNNRTALVRVPGKRMELRLADMAANPYLMAAAIGAAGLDGLTKKSLPPPPTDRNMYDPSDPIVAAAIGAAAPLPSNLLGALNELDKSDALRDGLGGEAVDSYLKLRRAHWDDFTSYLSPWEVQQYLDS